MKLCMFLIMLLAATTGTQAQDHTASQPQSQPRTSNLTGKNSKENYQTAMRQALDKGKFVLTDNQKEYKLATPVKPTGGSDDGIAVDYQVGLVKKKPAYATIFFNQPDVPKDSKKVDEMLNVLRGVQSHPEVQSCSKDNRRCVRWDDKGQCVRWSCG